MRRTGAAVVSAMSAICALVIVAGCQFRVDGLDPIGDDSDGGPRDIAMGSGDFSTLNDLALADLHLLPDLAMLPDLAHPLVWATPNAGTGDDLFAVWGASANDVYIAGDNGDMLHSSDGGMTWKMQNANTQTRFFGMWGSGANDVYAVGRSGFMCHTSDGGMTWTTVQTGTAENLYYIWGSGPKDVYSVGDNGTILHSTDGVNWTAQTANTGEVLTSVWGSSASDVYAAGNNGTLLHTSNGGITWAVRSIGVTTNVYTVSGSAPDDVYLGGESGFMEHASDGMTFVPQNPSSTHDFNNGRASGPGDVWFVGNHGTVRQTVDQGMTWRSIDIGGTSTDLNDVWPRVPDDVYVVGKSGLILHGR